MGQVHNSHTIDLGEEFLDAIQDDDRAILAIDARLQKGVAGPCLRDTDAGEVSHMIRNGRFAVTLGSDGAFDLAFQTLESCLFKLEARETRLPEDLQPSSHFYKIKDTLRSFCQKQPA